MTSREKPPRHQQDTAPGGGPSERGAGEALSYLPLSEDTVPGNGAVTDQSIGNLVKDAIEHIQTLIRAEIELAKAELVGEIKKAVKGSLFFLVALVVLLYSSFFFFFALSELLADIGLPRSAAFGIVFGAMLLFAGLFAFLGWRKVSKLKAPERTIDSFRATAATLSRKPAGGEAGTRELEHSR